MNEIGSGEDPSNTYEYTSSVVVALSATVASHQIQIKQLSDRLLLTACQHAEESCGRVNTDSLNRFVIIGAPYLEQSDQLQSRLKSQVCFFIDYLIVYDQCRDNFTSLSLNLYLYHALSEGGSCFYLLGGLLLTSYGSSDPH